MRRLREQGLDAGLVVDLGCGSGIGAAALLEAGYDVRGVDLSEAMLALARARAPSATFVLGSAYDADLGPGVVAVSAVGEVLNYACDARTGARARAALAERVQRALVPGGLFLGDVAGPGRRAPREWHEGEGWVMCHEAARDDAAGILTRRIVTLARAGELWRRGEETHVLRLIEPSAWRAELASTGLRARILGGYDGVELPPGLSVIEAAQR